MNKTNFHKIKLMFYAILAQKEYVFSFYFRKKWVTSKWRTLYNRGRLVKGHWIFGGYERDSRKIFIVPVEDRTEETLLACIKEWILPGTTIMSDCWKSYNCLNNEGFQHLTVNHSYNFVDPETSKKCLKQYILRITNF